MASEPKKLLQIQENTAPMESAYVWMVQDGLDYRSTLAAILSMVTKHRLGLGNVDNTADIDKPLSTSVAEALGRKANITDVVATETFNTLASSLLTYVKKEELDAIVIELNNLINSKASATEINSEIMAAVMPINTGITGILNRLDSFESGYITAYVRTGYFEDTLVALRAGLVSDYTTAILEGIEPLVISLNNYATELALLRDDFEAFKLMTNHRLEQLEQNPGSGTGEVTVGPNDW